MLQLMAVWQPGGLVRAAFSQPLVSLAIAALVAGCILLVASGRGDRESTAPPAVAARYVPEHRAAGVAAIAMIVLFATQNVVLGYIVNLSGAVAWWRHAAPLAWASLGVAVVLGLVVLRGTRPPESPTLPGTRRTWLSFGPRPGLAAGLVALIALVITTVAAGLASSPDGEGRFVWLVIPVPNEADIDPIRVVFFGWAYGIPVLVGAVLLAVVAWAALRANAVRPYVRPDTVSAEGGARRDLAQSVVHLATAGMLLALSGAWRLISDAGSGSRLTILGQNDGDPYEAAWRYAEFAVAAGWGAPALEVVAFVLLLLVSARMLRKEGVAPQSAEPEARAVEAAR